MQIKIIMWCPCTPIKIVKIKKTDNTKGWLEYGATGTLVYCWEDCIMVKPLHKMFR